MSLTFKAAADCHWFGTHYDAGDTIDTAGYTAAQIAKLMKSAPVYVSEGGGSATTTAVVSGVLGHADFADGLNLVMTIDAATDGWTFTDDDQLLVPPSFGVYLVTMFVETTSPWDHTGREAQGYTGAHNTGSPLYALDTPGLVIDMPALNADRATASQVVVIDGTVHDSIGTTANSVGTSPTTGQASVHMTATKIGDLPAYV